MKEDLVAPHIVSGCLKHGVKRLVFVSSPSIYTAPRDQINLTESDAPADNRLNHYIRSKILAALRKEAKSYLPRRLSFLAEEHGFSFARSKITHSSSRWGSCSSSGTISLNIGMMNLPFELIDYVIIHELCHTRHMNHSTKFWDEVYKFDPQYKMHRNELKKYSPYI